MLLALLELPRESHARMAACLNWYNCDYFEQYFFKYTYLICLYITNINTNILQLIKIYHVTENIKNNLMNGINKCYDHYKTDIK